MGLSGIVFSRVALFDYFGGLLLSVVRFISCLISFGVVLGIVWCLVFGVGCF